MTIVHNLWSGPFIIDRMVIYQKWEVNDSYYLSTGSHDVNNVLVTLITDKDYEKGGELLGRTTPAGYISNLLHEITSKEQQDYSTSRDI